MQILHSKTALNTPLGILRSENTSSMFKKDILCSKWKFYAQKMQILDSKTAVVLLNNPEFCARKMELLCSRNGNSILKNGNSALRKWKISPMPLKIGLNFTIFCTKSGIPRCLVLDSSTVEFHAKFHDCRILQGLVKENEYRYIIQMYIQKNNLEQKWLHSLLQEYENKFFMQCM